MKKRCTKCGEIKDISEFHKDKGSRDGLKSQCRSCIKEKSKKYYENNTEKVKIKRKEYRENNSEKANEATKKWYKNNPEKIKAIEEKRRLNLSDSIIARNLHIPVATLRQLPPELVELKRNIIKLKRAKNEKRND